MYQRLGNGYSVRRIRGNTGSCKTRENGSWEWTMTTAPDKVAYGTPDTVAQRIRQLRDDLGLTQFIYEIDLGNQLPLEMQLNSLRLFNKEVAPQLR